ncbi:hypothetical protein EXIGLDRAFT_524118 [Exidia glandulosa HHB12029]|uniref:Uncharacterized protein n=1 Tax=Exidia glandulosa HHB12029 TaxID=1314781 RepID=A0A165J149_EXIGL|nr:hypothetical protein EXIGLDRAFT_524118 [Exidia glandulosa HHB12029]
MNLPSWGSSGLSRSHSPASLFAMTNSTSQPPSTSSSPPSVTPSIEPASGGTKADQQCNYDKVVTAGTTGTATTAPTQATNAIKRSEQSSFQPYPEAPDLLESVRSRRVDVQGVANWQQQRRRRCCRSRKIAHSCQFKVAACQESVSSTPDDHGHSCANAASWPRQISIRRSGRMFWSTLLLSRQQLDTGLTGSISFCL